MHYDKHDGFQSQVGAIIGQSMVALSLKLLLRKPDITAKLNSKQPPVHTVIPTVRPLAKVIRDEDHISLVV